jgi:hypothetical protein
MEIQRKEMYSEVYSVLNLLGEKYIKKLPISLINMIKDERKKEYNPKYDLKANLAEQNIRRESLSMIALLHLNYWCESEEEKDSLKELFKNNEEIHQAEIREKYNPDNLFKNRIKEEKKLIKEEKEQTMLVPVKENFFTRFIKKLKNIFNIK